MSQSDPGEPEHELVGGMSLWWFVLWVAILVLFILFVVWRVDA